MMGVVAFGNAFLTPSIKLSIAVAFESDSPNF